MGGCWVFWAAKTLQNNKKKIKMGLVARESNGLGRSQQTLTRPKAGCGAATYRRDNQSPIVEITEVFIVEIT